MTPNRYSFQFDGPWGITLTTPDWDDMGHDKPTQRTIVYYDALRLRDELNQAIKEYEQEKRQREALGGVQEIRPRA